MPKPHALDYSPLEWKVWCQEQKLNAFVSTQVLDWIYKKEILSPDHFSNIPLKIRETLSNAFDWKLLEIDSHLISKDKSEKFLLKTSDNLFVEMVLMPSENRTTLCISCQVGCRMGCTFCQTGKIGFKRNLSSGEILSQIFLANQKSLKKVTNIVFMGMGEPLDNYEAVIKACSMMIAPQGFALSKSRVTISTAGLVPAIKKLGVDLPVRLAISLHSADEEQRSGMMPINKKYNLADLKAALLEYPAPERYGITFEYVLIEGVNDTLVHAKKLVSYLHGLKAKVNLIPINHFPGIEMHPSKTEKINAFQKYLTDRSIPAPVRYSRGQDISAGCGQLAAKREDELLLDPRTLRRSRISTASS